MKGGSGRKALFSPPNRELPPPTKDLKMKTRNLILPLLFAAPMALAQPAQKAADETDFFEDVVAKRILACKPHFDIEPYFVAAMGSDEDERITPAVRAAAADFGTTGRLKLTPEQQKNPRARECAVFAEGLITGSISYQFGKMMTEVMGKALGEAMGEMIKKSFEGLGESLKDPKNWNQK